MPQCDHNNTCWRNGNSFIQLLTLCDIGLVQRVLPQLNVTTTTPVGQTATVLYNLTLCDIGLVQHLLEKQQQFYITSYTVSYRPSSKSVAMPQYDHNNTCWRNSNSYI